MYRLRISLSTFILKFKMFVSTHKLIYKFIGLMVVIIVVFFAWTPTVNAISRQLDIRRFNNMPREHMIYDFEYLMTALEENWPFFNLSLSANNIDVRALADYMRILLRDPATPINCPIDFLDIMQIHFFEPIGQLGHLRQETSCERYFATRTQFQFLVEQFLTNAHNRTTVHINNLYNRPEVVLFYSRLRDTGRGSLPHTFNEPVMTFGKIEAGRTAYIKVNRMIDMADDIMSSVDPRMWHYEHLMYLFNQDIEGYENLIIDFRGNPGGRSGHFRALIMPMLLQNGVTFSAYVFYMDGKYANQAREVFDVRNLYRFWLQADWNYYFDEPIMQIRHFTEPLPYLDMNISFAYSFESRLDIEVVYHYYGFMASAREEVLFDGKIWVLIDENTASAAEAIVAVLKYNSIATVVGEPTFGIFGIDHEAIAVNMSLPNTGILIRFDVAYYTDLYGRPLQGYGIQPHYFNRSGMDALETVLAMIAEE